MFPLHVKAAYSSDGAGERGAKSIGEYKEKKAMVVLHNANKQEREKKRVSVVISFKEKA